MIAVEFIFQEDYLGGKVNAAFREPDERTFLLTSKIGMIFCRHHIKYFR